MHFLFAVQAGRELTCSSHAICEVHAGTRTWLQNILRRRSHKIAYKRGACRMRGVPHVKGRRSIHTSRMGQADW